MNLLSSGERELRNRIENLNDEILGLQNQIKELQKQCDHKFMPCDGFCGSIQELKYCVICGHEDYK
jgi:peptidoglycan hydrolase CwlO-like protein